MDAMQQATAVTVLRPGTPVLIGPNRDVEAEIVRSAVEIDMSVAYQVTWWNGSEPAYDWLKECQLRVALEIGAVQIGFHASKDQAN